MGGCDAAIKNKNGRHSLNTMTSFLPLAACIAQAGKKEKENFHLALIREDANLNEGVWRPQRVTHMYLKPQRSRPPLI